MSYILDALRRADSERESGTLPGLHTQPVPVSAADVEAERPSSIWRWLVALAFATLLGVVVWLLWSRPEAPEPPSAVNTVNAANAATAATASAPSSPAAAPGVSPAPPGGVSPSAAPSAAPSATPAPTASAREAAGPARRPAAAAPAGTAPAATSPLTAATAASPAALPADSPAIAARKTAAPAPAPTAAAQPSTRGDTAAKASAPEARVLALSELPEEVRRGLPAITIGGSIYSRSAANRMLVINGQVFHEGDELMPALMLEQIKPKAAVLNFKGFRYEVSYQ